MWPHIYLMGCCQTFGLRIHNENSILPTKIAVNDLSHLKEERSLQSPVPRLGQNILHQSLPAGQN